MKNANGAVKICEFDIEIKEIIISYLKPTESGKICRIEDLLPPDLWRSICDGQRRLIGKSFMKLSKENLIPFKFVGRTSANHSQYLRLP